MFIIKHKQFFIFISLILIAASSIFLLVKGLSFGIDFTGGSQIELSYEGERPDVKELDTVLRDASFPSVLQVTGDTGLLIRTRTLSEEDRISLFEILDQEGVVKESSFTSIGPSIGHELQKKATIALIAVMIAIILFVAYVFREVSDTSEGAKNTTGRVSSWKYGLVAVFALIHDVVVTTGIFAVVSVFTGMQADALFVVALLTILGLSVNDTIVVFDRIRENLGLHKDMPFQKVVGMSLDQSFARAINTSLTTVIVLLALVFWGPASTQAFALTLAFGMVVGTYSSIFFASPFLVYISKSKT